MKMMARIKPVAEQYTASEALVLPVLAHAARRAATTRACVNAADMPLSLKLPEGFIPSYCRNRQPGLMPAYAATESARCRIVWPSPIVMIRSGGANGRRSWKRHTPLKQSGSVRWDHFASICFSDFGGAKRSQSYATSSKPPHFGQRNEVSSTAAVAPQWGWIQR